VAMGKYGAYELNYSSDIDITFFYDSELMLAHQSTSAAALAVKVAERTANILQSRTSDGYVFRVDLRLRPDPLSTPIAVSLNAAHLYYESVGQNWERAAFIKARVAAGDIATGDRFLEDLKSFVWRRNLDFAAISDIQSILVQIQSNRKTGALSSGGAASPGERRTDIDACAK
jgi:glutamate-ammonia-ligase adenylyltransferase